MRATQTPVPCRGGITLVEVVVAVGLAALLLASVAPVTVMAARAVDRARLHARAMAAAASHLERLRALPWYLLQGGGVVLDDVSRVADAGFVAGGPGLSPGPANVLDSVHPAYADEPSTFGVLMSPDVRLHRRWRVTSLPADAGCVLLTVEVAAEQALADGQTMEHAALARVHTVRCVAGARP